ncbi:MAG: hypothetical protein ACRCTA_00075, partial [Bacilli bacterium]
LDGNDKIELANEIIDFSQVTSYQESSKQALSLFNDKASIIEYQLSYENLILTYEFKVLEGKIEHEVLINATTNEVISNTIDN